MRDVFLETLELRMSLIAAWAPCDAFDLCMLGKGSSWELRVCLAALSSWTVALGICESGNSALESGELEG